MTFVMQDYLDLIPPPNKIQPNLMGWLEANLTPDVDSGTLNEDMAAYFAIETAVGDQLDILGEILGLSRTVKFQPSGGVSPVLSDENYRIVLKAKIIQNQWDGTKNQLYAFWDVYFPGTPIIILDNQNMTMDVFVVGLASTLQQELVENGYYVPKPAGVRVAYTFAVTPLFGWNLDNAYIKGWDEGEWATF